MRRISGFFNQSEQDVSSRNYEDFVNELNDKVLYLECDNFYTNPPVIPPMASINTLDELVSSNIIIGEFSHSCMSSKNFLISNMNYLKAQGFTTLFMEHLYYDDQAELDHFCKSPTHAKIPAKLKSRLKELDAGHGMRLFCGPVMKKNIETWSKNNFTALVKAAKQAGIRVVAIDTAYLYEQQDNHKDHYGENLDGFRYKSMNFSAYQIIKREMHQTSDKWLALIGSAHLKTYHNVPGLADLLQARAVLIDDAVVTDENDQTCKVEVSFSKWISLNEMKRQKDIEIFGEMYVKDSSPVHGYQSDLESLTDAEVESGSDTNTDTEVENHEELDFETEAESQIPADISVDELQNNSHVKGMNTKEMDADSDRVMIDCYMVNNPFKTAPQFTQSLIPISESHFKSD